VFASLSLFEIYSTNLFVSSSGSLPDGELNGEAEISFLIISSNFSKAVLTWPSRSTIEESAFPKA
jgi:hypothetical protein